MVKAYSYAPLNDAVMPVDGTVDIMDPLDFVAQGSGWQYLTKTWKINGATVGTGDVMTIHPWHIASPSSTLTLDILDNTPLIKSYPLRTEQHSLTLVSHVTAVANVVDLNAMPDRYVSVSGVVSAKFADHFYVQDEERTGGVRVYPCDSSLPDVGKTVSLCGKRELDNMNLTLTDCKWTAQSATSQPPSPLGMANLSLGGAPLGMQRGAHGSLGAHNVGLLVTVWGNVMMVDGSGLWMSVNDGSLGSGIRVYGDGLFSYANKYVRATGICFLDEAGFPSMSPAVRTRGRSDVVAYSRPW